MCQDTGLVVCFVEIGYDVHIIGDLYKAIDQGVREAYEEGFFRKSVVDGPFSRKKTLGTIHLL